MKAIIFILISAVIIFNSCKKECPPFNRELLCWLPQAINDTLKFIDNQNDTLVFKINDKVIFDDNTTYRRNNKCQCGSEAHFNAVSLQNSNHSIFEKIIYSNVNEIYFNISININEKRGEFSLFTENVDMNSMNSIIIDDHIYNNVIIIENDTIKYPTISDYWKIVISRDIGLVKIYARENKIWTLTE